MAASGWFCGRCTLANECAATTCAMCGALPPRVAFVIPEGVGNSVYLCAKSLDAALHNCAISVAAVRRVVCQRGAAAAAAMVLARPPGHHAASEKFGSYCLLNTVAITARAMLDEGLSPGRLPPPPPAGLRTGGE